MSGFTTPGLLFLEGWNQPQRTWTRDLLTGLRAYGYIRTVEPCSGALAMSVMARAGGFGPAQIEASDVSLLSSVVGYLMAGVPVGDLGVHVDGELFVPDGEDEIDRGADILIKQLELRLAQRQSVHWNEYVRDVQERRAIHREKVAKTLRDQHFHLAGLKYDPMGLWEHVAEVKDDPHTVILAAPPSYKGGYEKLYDTGGRMTWTAEPRYEMFTPGEDHATLMARAENYKALLICVEPTAVGDCTHPDPLSAYDMAKGRAMYIWSNRPDECRRVKDRPHMGQRTYVEPVKPRWPVLPYDYELTEDAQVQVTTMAASEAKWVRDLWSHRIAAGELGAGNAIAIILDGHLAGIAGYLTTAQFSSRISNGDYAIIQGAMGAPHLNLRLNRLAIALSLTRYSLNLALPIWNASRVEHMITHVFTRHPESKINRGIMQLRERRPDLRHGYRLTYDAPVDERPPQEVAAQWLAKELRRQKAPAQASA